MKNPRYAIMMKGRKAIFYCKEGEICVRTKKVRNEPSAFPGA